MHRISETNYRCTITIITIICLFLHLVFGPLQDNNQHSTPYWLGKGRTLIEMMSKLYGVEYQIFGALNVFIETSQYSFLILCAQVHPFPFYSLRSSLGLLPMLGGLRDKSGILVWISYFEIWGYKVLAGNEAWAFLNYY